MGVADPHGIDLCLNKCLKLGCKPGRRFTRFEFRVQDSRLLRAGESEGVLGRMKLESEVFAERLASAEAKEAFTAFFEKRKPNFGD